MKTEGDISEPSISRASLGARILRSTALAVAIALCMSVPAGYALMWPLGRAFDLAGLPIFGTWALMHGSAILAWPALTLVVFGVTWWLVRSGQRRLH